MSPARRLEALFVSENSGMRAVLERAARVGERPETPVRIEGEAGSGKEVLARFIQACTPERRDGAFVRVACAGAGEELLEAELFGLERAPGALEQAHGGTLFLEDVAELPGRLQLELLRTLKTGRVRRLAGTDTAPFDARVIVASTADLARAVRQGALRAELYHRLDVVQLSIPPLRLRREDILPLARFFLQRIASQWVRPVPSLSPEAEAALMAHDFPGNVRELRNAIEGALTAERGELIGPDALALGPPAGAAGEERFFEVQLDDERRPPPLEEVEKRYLERVLVYAKGNRSEVARVLGVSYPTVTRKIAEYGIKLPG